MCTTYINLNVKRTGKVTKIKKKQTSLVFKSFA